ncbi:hypothetical protein RSOLAG1IB_08033 [Rhizoctonia solani AG-1 IB]|uniref:Uncharacterized protein n=1 Tax=Thanatephorus cucumeris (strain AG1-IB / isolate 7/3/14) TaxID=1108050 RepID=M5CEA7_THACB|nr:hypothetical protein BN14_08321 [Rhizoctonia solani AG-1 IB]CEL56707.1 hypothetical protein RSOLAG1IB_08033 [Rhizoctonia solani AG-1 IB]
MSAKCPSLRGALSASCYHWIDLCLCTMTLDTPVDKFLLSTSDVLEGPQKTYIKCSKTGEIKWCKTRTLTLNEVIDELHAGSELAYSIHRPTRGWYIRVRSHTKPLLVTDLIPDPLVDTAQPDADSILMFNMPVVGPKGKERQRESAGSSSLAEQDEYSFPPTPPIRSPPPGKRQTDSAKSELLSEPSSPTTALHTDPLRSPDPPRPPAKLDSRTLGPQPTLNLVFAPAPAPKVPPNPSFSRAFASGLFRAVTSTIFSPPRRSFSLSARSSGGDGAATTPALESGPRFELERVLEYEDTTPVFSVSQITGTITVLNSGHGDTGLMVACAMAYLDFLAERDGYIASANGG